MCVEWGERERGRGSAREAGRAGGVGRRKGGRKRGAEIGCAMLLRSRRI
jgi:hypothetical protein